MRKHFRGLPATMAITGIVLLLGGALGQTVSGSAPSWLVVLEVLGFVALVLALVFAANRRRAVNYQDAARAENERYSDEKARTLP